MKKLIVTIFFLIIFIGVAFSKRREEIGRDFQSWNNITAFGGFDKVDPRLSNFIYELTYQERFGDDASRHYQTLLRGGIGYKLNERHSLWLGADYIKTRDLVPELVNTSGIWQQYLYKNKYNDLKYFFRARLEELIISTRKFTVLRGRYMLRGAYPISENRKTEIIAFNEFFNNFNGDGNIENATLIQNRAFAGLGYNFNKTAHFEIGYMNQYVHNSNGFDFTSDILFSSLILNF
jgi:hypothetical protein